MLTALCFRGGVVDAFAELLLALLQDLRVYRFAQLLENLCHGVSTYYLN